MFCIFNSPPPFFLLNTLIIIKKKSIKDDMTIKCTLHFLFDFKLYVLLIPPSPPPPSSHFLFIPKKYINIKFAHLFCFIYSINEYSFLIRE